MKPGSTQRVLHYFVHLPTTLYHLHDEKLQPLEYLFVPTLKTHYPSELGEHMIKSMTAFSRQELEINGNAYTWELRSLNHRYLDIHCKLPESLKHLEMPMRELIRRHLSRGKVECNLKEQRSETDISDVKLNTKELDALMSSINTVHQTSLKYAALSPTLTTSTLQILQWPGVLQHPESNVEETSKQLLAGFDIALSQLSTVRANEGDKLKNFILSRSKQATSLAIDLQKDLPTLLLQQKQNLLDRLAALQTEIEPQRLEQELVLLIQKSDIAEELDRLNAHVQEVDFLLTKKSGVVGRRLDFLMQELNREANTLGSKSNSLQTTQVAVELKVLFEQMREQIQNIE